MEAASYSTTAVFPFQEMYPLFVRTNNLLQ